MDARGAAHLGHAADRLFDFLGRHEHEVGQLVDDDDDLRHLLKFAAGHCDVVERFEVARPCVGHQPVTAHHLRHRPLQRAGRLLRVGHDGDEQVRNAVVNAKLHHLRVDHDELDLIRLCLVEQRDNQRIHADRLAGAGCARDEHMRQLGDVADDAAAADVLADSERNFGLALAEFVRVDHVPRQHRRHQLVRHFDADDRNFIRDGRDAHAGRAERQRNIVRQICHLGQLRPAAQLQLIPRDRRPARHIDDVRLNVEALQRIGQALGVLPHLLCAVRRRAGRTAQQIDRRIAVFRRRRGRLDLGGNLRGFLPDVLALDLVVLRLHQRRQFLRRFRLWRFCRGFLRLRGNDQRLEFFRRVLLNLFRFLGQRRELLRLRVQHEWRQLMRQLLLLRDQRVKLRFVIFLRRRLRFLFRFRFRRGGLGVAGQLAGQIVCQVDGLLPARILPVLFHKLVGPDDLAALLLRLRHGQRRLVDRQIEVRRLRAPPLHLLDVPLRHMVHKLFCRVGMFAPRRLILELRPVFDCENDALHGHVQARDQRQKEARDAEDHRADLAHHQLQHQRQPSGDHAAGRSGDAAVPEVLEHILAPFHAASADELHQRPDQHRHEERTRHPQRHGPPVMQQQDQEAHQKRER